MAITSGVLDTYDPDLREIGGGGVMPHDNPLETLEIHARARSRGIVSSIDL